MTILTRLHRRYINRDRHRPDADFCRTLQSYSRIKAEDWRDAEKRLGHIKNCHCSTCALAAGLQAAIRHKGELK
jgi:hypothetical protein